MRARSIKPGFFDNEILAEAGPYAQILFAGLWCLADKSGRLEDRPKRIKAKIFPYYEPKPSVENLLNTLEGLGFIIRYSVNGKKIISIINFLRHQSPHHTEKESDLPEYQPDVNGEITVVPPFCNGGNPPDSLFTDSLFTDSLTPESPTQESGVSFQDTLSGEPDVERSDAKEKTSNGIPYSEIVDHLNRMTGRRFREDNKDTRKLIKARWKDGFTLTDFKTVIEVKSSQWLNDPERTGFLRPETLFGKKFESYLNESARASPQTCNPAVRAPTKMFGKAGIAAMDAIRTAKGMM